jgi:hypothetical protein
MGVRVTPGLSVMNAFPVIAEPGVEREPDIAYDGENYLVVWSDGIFGYDHKVRAARVTVSGAVIDTGIDFGAHAYYEYRPCVEFDGDRYLAVWYNYSDDPYGLFARFITTECQLSGEKIEIRLIDYAFSFEPDIAFCDSNYLIVWNEMSPNVDHDVYGQIVGRNGELVNGPVLIAVSPEYENAPRVCAGDSRFLVVWNRNSEVYGQWLSVNGDLIGNNFRISTAGNDNRNSPDVSMCEGNALVAWHEFNTDNFDIFGNTVTDLVLPDAQAPLFLPYYHTVFSGEDIDILNFSHCRIFDVNGRETGRKKLIPGIYFIEMPGKMFIKLIKI